MLILSSLLYISQEFSAQAQSNMTFLSILKEPLEELARLKPSQVIPKLQDIVSLICIIWNNSLHYNTNERIGSLFCKVPTYYCIRVIGKVKSDQVSFINPLSLLI